MVAPDHNKQIVGAEPYDESRQERGARLLRQVAELAALPEGKTLWIEGAERGWQHNDGFYVLACALRRVAKNPEKVKRLFVEAATANGHGLDEWDAERQWDNAALAVVEDDLTPAPMSEAEAYEEGVRLLRQSVALFHESQLQHRRKCTVADPMADALLDARANVTALAEELGYLEDFAEGARDLRDTEYVTPEVYATRGEPMWFAIAKRLLDPSLGAEQLIELVDEYRAAMDGGARLFERGAQ